MPEPCRYRAYRARRDAGRGVLRVEVDIIALAEALIEAGMLAREHEDDRAEIAAAAGRVLDTLSRATCGNMEADGML